MEKENVASVYAGKRILVTGASGFIGSFIVEEALRRGMQVWAAVRKSSSRQYLQDERIRFFELNLSSESELKEQLKDVRFDYVVHAAGVTKCLHKEDFHRINTKRQTIRSPTLPTEKANWKQRHFLTSGQLKWAMAPSPMLYFALLGCMARAKKIISSWLKASRDTPISL